MPPPELTTSPMPAPAPAPPAAQSATACARDHPKGTQHERGAMLPNTAPAAAPISPPRITLFAAERRGTLATPAEGMVGWVRALPSKAWVTETVVQSSRTTACIALPGPPRKSFMERTRVPWSAGGRFWAARAVVPHITRDAHCRHPRTLNRIWYLTLLKEEVVAASPPHSIKTATVIMSTRVAPSFTPNAVRQATIRGGRGPHTQRPRDRRPSGAWVDWAMNNPGATGRLHRVRAFGTWCCSTSPPPSRCAGCRRRLKSAPRCDCSLAPIHPAMTLGSALRAAKCGARRATTTTLLLATQPTAARQGSTWAGQRARAPSRVRLKSVRPSPTASECSTGLARIASPVSRTSQYRPVRAPQARSPPAGGQRGAS